MIKRIIGSTFFALCLFSISLYLMGVTEVELGPTFMAFLRNCSRELESFKLAIPDIPHIPDITEVENQFLQVVQGIIVFLNGLVDVINFIIMVINTIISLLQFVFIILKNFITARDSLVGA